MESPLRHDFGFKRKEYQHVENSLEEMVNQISRFLVGYCLGVFFFFQSLYPFQQIPTRYGIAHSFRIF
jgi:hypothetical protein